MIELSTTDENLSPAAAAVRLKLMDGLAPLGAFAQAIGRGERQVQNWIADGLPCVRYGKTPYIVIDEAKRWLISRSATAAA
jgi:hypothetical protein